MIIILTTNIHTTIIIIITIIILLAIIHTFQNLTIQTVPETAGKKKTRYPLGEVPVQPAPISLCKNKYLPSGPTGTNSSGPESSENKLL